MNLADLPGVAECAPTDAAGFASWLATGRKPLVFRQLVADWPIVVAGRHGRDAVLDHIVARASALPAQAWVGHRGCEGRFGYDAEGTGFNFDRRLAPVAEIVAFLRRGLDREDRPDVFAGAINLERHLPGLLPEITMPLLHTGQHRLVSLWIGTPGKTAAHWDYAENFACPVLGPREFLLFPPAAFPDLHVGPLDPTPAGQPISLVDWTAPDFVRFPKARRALEQASWVRLLPGDVLYLPSMWFHHVVSPDPVGAQVNLWWHEGEPGRPSPLAALLAAQQALFHARDEERAAWRLIFDHVLAGAGAGPFN